VRPSQAPGERIIRYQHLVLEECYTIVHVHTRKVSLRERGARLQALADEARQEIARRLLERFGLKVSPIAASLDDADGRAFARGTATH
jgi:hypothetical protein